MPISAGEVESTLRIKVQSDLRLAQTELRDLQKSFDDFNTKVGANRDEEAMQRVSAAIQTAQDKIAGAKAALGDFNREGDNAGVTFTRFDGIIERMAFRLALLYAARGTFDFVKGIFEGADATVRLNEQLGLTITTLETLQYGAGQADIPFAKVSQAVGTLDKNLAEMKVSAIEAINGLGLSFDHLISEEPDKRFEDIATAIAAIPDKLKRSKAEFDLFGTDAIDPLIVNFQNLKKAAADSIIPEQTERNLSAVAEAYRGFGTSVKKYTAEALDELQKLAAKIFIMEDSSTSMQQKIDAIKLLNVAVQQTKTTTDQAITSEDILAKILKEQADTVAKLTDAQKRELDVLHQANLDTEQNAARLGISVLQYKEYEKSVHAAAAELKRFEETQKHQGEEARRQDERWLKDRETADKEIVQLDAKANTARLEQYKEHLKLQTNLQAAYDEDYLIQIKDLYNQGKISAETYYSDLAILAGKQASNHIALLQQEKATAISELDERQKAETAKYTEQYEKGKLLYTEYQQILLKIATEYAAKRASIEEQFATQLTIFRLSELQKQEAAAQALADKDKKRIDDFMKQMDEREKLNSKGFSFEVNFSNLVETAQGMGITGNVEELAKEGYSFGEIVSIMRTGRKGKPVGPRIPGFAYGGTSTGGAAIVGEQGPELVNLPSGSTVTPGVSGTGKVEIHNHFHGTPESMAMEVGYKMMETLKMARLLPAAG